MLDTAPEREFDALVQAAALVCGVPISLISLIDMDRQWFKANVGLPDVDETSRDLALCAHAIHDDGILEVEDASADPRFSDNALVTGDPDIRFYAGATLRLSDGARVGTLCVIDRQPRRLDAMQRQVLGYLAEAAVRALEGRRALKVERELRETASQAAAVLRHSRDAIITTALDGTVTHWNAAAQRLLGYEAAEMLGRTLRDILPDSHGSDGSDLATLLHQHREGVTYESARLHRNGEAIAVSVSLAPILDANEEIIGATEIVRDIGEQVLAAQVLAESEARARDLNRRMASILEGTGAGTWEWNVQTGETRFNEQWARIVGRTLDELAPTSIQTWMDLAHPDDLARSGDLLTRHFAGHSTDYECEARLLHRDGHWVWVLDRGRVLSWTTDGKPEWMFGTHIDLTARKTQEEALQRSEQLLNRTGEVAGVGGWELDLLTGALIWTAQTRRIHGVPPDYQPTLEAAINFYAPEARAVIHAVVERAMALGEGWDLEVPLVQANGTRIWVRAVGQAEFAGERPVRMRGAFQDVTRMRHLTAELAEQHELLQVTLQSIGDAVITTDGAGLVTWLNPVAERLTGWGNADAKGRELSQVFHVVSETSRNRVDDPTEQADPRHMRTGSSDHRLLISRDGTEYGIEASTSAIRTEEGASLGAVIVIRDVTEQRHLTSELSYRASHDGLTGLVNRSEFEARLRRTLQKARDDRSEHALMYIDLDQFKIVNDACGHSVGDQLLQQVGKLLTDTVRARDTLARLGGDEFAVILEHCTVGQAQRVAQQICEKMDDYRFIHDGRPFRIGASIGLVPVDARWETTASVLQAADASCYAAKEAGRNRVHAWVDRDDAVRARNGEMQWAARIAQALDENRFVLHAQHIASLRGDSHGVHAEALLRLIERDGTLVLPGAFLPAAERFQLASRIDRWVLRHAIEHMVALPDLAIVDTLCINLSGHSIGDRAFHRLALQTLADAGAEVCQRLCLEITETAAVTNLSDAATFTRQARSLGVRIALDDFGAGASSFSHLKSLEVDYLKIDGQFIKDVVVDRLDDAAVRGFVDVARVVGVKTVAEFVDRPEILARVREIGIDFAQGFLMHRPEPLETILGVTPRDVALHR